MGSRSRQTFDEISEAIGRDAALRLSLCYRGRRIFVLKHYADADPMVAAIGRAAADLLSETYQGDSFVVPSTQGLKAEVFRLADNGVLTRNEIAAQLYLSERQVYRWLEARTVGGRQADLFEPHGLSLSFDS